MIYDFKLLGGVVADNLVWNNNYADSQFHEVGNGNWRVSFTPTAPGKVMVMTHLSRARMGATGNSRLYFKARIVSVAPVYKNDYVLFGEGCWEGTAGYGDQIRFFDAPTTLFIVADITEEAVGLTHSFAVEHLAGDTLHGEVGYGSPLVLFG